MLYTLTVMASTLQMAEELLKELKVIIMSTKIKIPAWFNGEIYKEGGEVTNPFSGSSYELNNVELSMYDFIIGCQLVMEMQPKLATQQRIKDFHKGLSWFRQNNGEAYMVLLD